MIQVIDIHSIIVNLVYCLSHIQDRIIHQSMEFIASKSMINGFEAI